MPVLTGIDIIGIQGYVFASNRLRDVISASWLVHWATANDGALAEVGTGEEMEVILAGGGNAILKLEDEASAYRFAACYSRLIYDEAPGLELVVAHYPYKYGHLAEAIGELQKALSVAKLERKPSIPQLGISVTASCQVSGLPASGLDPQDKRTPLSRMVLRWRDEHVRIKTRRRWEAYLPEECGCLFPEELDKIGRTAGERSLIGVVHVDGNGMGKAIGNWLSTCIKKKQSDDEVKKQLNEWSGAIDKIASDTFKKVVQRTYDAIEVDKKGDPVLTGAIPELSFPLKSDKEGRIFLPIRPVLLGGDDLTFLCDGRIALDLAQTALEAFKGKVLHLGEITACGGVAIVPAHSPFERAYVLSESLCASAKRKRRENMDSDSDSWLDWHIGAPKPGETTPEIRSRKYSSRARSRARDTELELTCRPYRLGSSPDDVESWRWFSERVLGTEDSGFRGEVWSLHRNKLKELSAVVREGPQGVRHAWESWTVAGSFPWPKGLENNAGFFDGVRTPLLDALELLDIHLPLDRGKK